ncbi:DUF3800 domain-containing protein [Desulfobacula sp.]|uniref:DUF3800 domain-containing protein n=1 Tax=Desulfobacula sp. TaxID=2593537 RepID=UPI001ED5538E|nr:DUF3800 domain-containing protein [Desulfobacula sp.]
MYLLYIDESGTSAIPGNTSHFILAGISVPIWHWKDCDKEISNIKNPYNLNGKEIHTAWILRKYLEQSRIPNFESLDFEKRRSEVLKSRNRHLLNLQSAGKIKAYRQTKKNYLKTDDYIHLTYNQRKEFIDKIANCVSNWGFARLFAECIDKIYFDPTKEPSDIDHQAFEQIVSRFDKYLVNISEPQKKQYGLLIHDNNQTVARRLTKVMKEFHKTGTLWREIENIIETPLFVDSELTSLVQIADLCSYSIRRYLENNEPGLFSHIFKRADRVGGTIVVGMRHYSEPTCDCEICKNHKYI